MLRALVFLILLLPGCASFSPALVEAEEADEMWTYARAHKTFERADTGDERHVPNVALECMRLGIETTNARACTSMGAHAFTLIAEDATRHEREHERAHRELGDWHAGFHYYTQRQAGLYQLRYGVAVAVR